MYFPYRLKNIGKWKVSTYSSNIKSYKNERDINVKLKRHRYTTNSLYPCNVHFKQSNPLIKDAASVQREKRKLYKRETRREKLNGTENRSERDFILRKLSLYRKKKNKSGSIQKALPAAGFFFKLFGYVRARTRARSRAMARYFGRRHVAQWAKRYY